MDVPPLTNAEMAQLVAMLKDVGLVEVFVDDDGHEGYRLTDDGVRVGHMLAMGGESDAVIRLADFGLDALTAVLAEAYYAAPAIDYRWSS